MLKALCLVSALLFSSYTHATLIDRGNGMIYDTATNLTWLQDFNYSQTSGYDADGLMTWANAMQWADNLVFGGFSDWRLPTVSPVNGATFSTSISYNGTSDIGYNVNSQHSELASLFYALGGVSRYTSSMQVLYSGYGVPNFQPFTNFFLKPYMAGNGPALNSMFVFGFRDGGQNAYFGSAFTTQALNTIAVREGDVLPEIPLPEPYPLLLMGIGLIALSNAHKSKPSLSDALPYQIAA